MGAFPYVMGMRSPPLEITFTLPTIAPCEHIAGNEKFVRKALGLQNRFLAPCGRSLMDITIDLEDGAPVGHEEELRQLAVTSLRSPENVFKQMGVRIHPPGAHETARDLEAIIRSAGAQVAYLTVPKVRTAREVRWIAGVMQHHLQAAGIQRTIPLHLLIETPEAISAAAELAKMPEVETLDFGLMDFVSHLGGAVPASCMRSPGQFEHRLLSGVKSSIALAALSAGKIPNHNVTVDVRDPESAYADAYRARNEFGFLRMWSIHPDQIEPIIRGMMPSAEELQEARAIIAAAQAAAWGPIKLDGRLHDRASYRYYWGLLQRAGEGLPKNP